jgi:hypothetical protein
VIAIDNECKELRLKPSNYRCPHLDSNQKCKVHDMPWYESTPCYIYGNSYIDPDFYLKRNKPCPIGEGIKNKKVEFNPNKYPVWQPEDE